MIEKERLLMEIIDKYKFQIGFLGGLLLYFLVVYFTLIASRPISEYPSLRARIGTILWHSSDRTTSPWLTTQEIHIYCYYPSGKAEFPNKGGEYLLKRVSVVSDCDNWYGAVFIEEDKWVSEREKIWWDEQNVAEDSRPRIESPATYGQV